MNKELIDQLKQDEGFRSKPYRCTAGKLTIGYGRNIEDNGITQQEAEQLLINDITRVRTELSNKFDWFFDIPESKQNVLINMCFNLGISRLLGFKKFLAALKVHNYSAAADEMLDSKWAKQVGARAMRLANIMRS